MAFGGAHYFHIDWAAQNIIYKQRRDKYQQRWVYSEYENSDGCFIIIYISIQSAGVEIYGASQHYSILVRLIFV